MRSPYIHLLRTPRLESIDSPFQEDGRRYETELEMALRKQLFLAKHEPAAHRENMDEKLRQYAWESVFDRVQQVYDTVLGR